MENTRPIVLAGLLAVALAACGAGDDPPNGQAPDREVSPGGEANAGDVNITFALPGEPSLAQLASVYALSQIEAKYGYAAEYVETTETSIMLEGVNSGEFQIAEGAATSVMNAVARGGDLRIVAVSSDMQYVLAAPPGVETCGDLAGLRLGLHAAGSSTEAYYNIWAEENCTEEERDAIQVLYIAGGDVRAQAMIGGQLDVSLLGVEDLPVLGDEFSVMVSFIDVLAGRVVPNPVSFGSGFLRDHPEAAQHFLEELVVAQGSFSEDPSNIVAAASEVVPSFDAEYWEPLAQTAYELGLFEINGGADILGRMDEITAFLVEMESIEPEVGEHAGSFVDLEPLEAALEASG